jgi:hypothetical protein
LSLSIGANALSHLLNATQIDFGSRVSSLYGSRRLIIVPPEYAEYEIESDGVPYGWEGICLVNCKAQNASSDSASTVGSAFAEKHFSPKELAALWGLSTDAIRRLFRKEEGVLLLPSRNPRRSLRANYNTMLIPESVAKRVHVKYSFGKQ